jgi:hypothetical protein
VTPEAGSCSCRGEVKRTRMRRRRLWRGECTHVSAS